MSFLSLIAGLLLLIGGGEALVRGAARIALLARIPPAIVGLTVVAAGTSAPELVVALASALEGTPDLAVGNVLGSNIYNIALILGLAAAVRPLPVRGNTVRLEWPVMLLASVQMGLLARDGTLDRVECGALVLALVVFIAYQVRIARVELTDAERGPLEGQPRIEPGLGFPVALGMSALGGVLLAVGAELFVSGASDIARTFGVAEHVIGLTVVAVGTSLPELVASLVAAIRGHTDLAITNVIGSNIFNVLLILGVTGLVSPLPVQPQLLSSDVPWMIALALLLFPLMRTNRVVTRWEGVGLLGVGAVYTGTLVL